MMVLLNGREERRITIQFRCMSGPALEYPRTARMSILNLDAEGSEKA